MIVEPQDPAAGFPLPEPVPSSMPGWMITFADLLSLLLSFFVLMFATTTIDRAAWTKSFRPVTIYFGARPPAVPGAPEPQAPPVAAALDMNYLGATLRQLAAQDPSLAGATVRSSEHRALFSLPAGLLPCSGTIDPKRLAGLAAMLGNIDNRIEITAHAGLDPTRAAGPESWSRALNLADSVAADLARAGVTRPIRTVGQADLPGGEKACAVEVLLTDETDGKAGGGHGI